MLPLIHACIRCLGSQSAIDKTVVKWAINELDKWVLSPTPHGLLCKSGPMDQLVDLAINAIPPLSPAEKKFLKQHSYPFPMAVVPTIKTIGANAIRHSCSSGYMVEAV